MDQTLSILHDSNLIGLFFWNHDGRITQANRTFLGMVGYSTEDMAAGRVDWQRMTPPEYQAVTRQRHDEMLLRGVCPPYEKEYIRKDGSRVPIMLGVALLKNSCENGICFVIDITEHKRTQQALRQREATLESLIQNMPFDVWARDEQGRAILQNVPSRQLWGDMVGQRPQEQTIAPEVRAEWLENNRRAMEGEVIRKETRYVQDGEPRTFYSIIAPIREGSRVRGIIGTNIDITEQKRDEQRLREAEERYRTLFEQSPYGIIVIEPTDGRFVEFNGVAHAQLGYAREEFARFVIGDLDAVESAEQTAAHVQRILETGHESFETRHRTRGGELRDMLISARVLSIGGRTLLHTLHQDMTERNRLKEQLLQSQKMEAIGLLAGGIAHDFNNLLAVISGYSEALTRHLPESDPLYAHATEIQRAADRGANLTRQLLAFSRRQPAVPQVLDLNRVVEGLGDLLRRIISRGIDVVTVPDRRLWSIKADPSQMEQVIVNLALNARDAMPDGGTITVATSNVRLAEDAARLAGVRPGCYVRLAVTDTGAGMDDDTRARVFEPFFTTKASRGGTGLGLSIVYGIAQQCEGNVTVRSQLGQGSCFEVLLPAL